MTAHTFQGQPSEPWVMYDSVDPGLVNVWRPLFQLCTCMDSRSFLSYRLKQLRLRHSNVFIKARLGGGGNLLI